MSAEACRTADCSGKENIVVVVNGTTQTTQEDAPPDSSGAFGCAIIGSTHPSTHHTAPKPTTTRSTIPTTRRMRANLACVRSIDATGIVDSLPVSCPAAIVTSCSPRDVSRSSQRTSGHRLVVAARSDQNPCGRRQQFSARVEDQRDSCIGQAVDVASTVRLERHQSALKETSEVIRCIGGS